MWGRHLNLALLAPDIVEAILTGQEPDGLSLEKLHRLPLAWEEQRRALDIEKEFRTALNSRFK